MWLGKLELVPLFLWPHFQSFTVYASLTDARFKVQIVLAEACPFCHLEWRSARSIVRIFANLTYLPYYTV
jgi:hypothetical protein